MILTPLQPHQLQALKALSPLPASGCWMDFGLGKSLVALALVEDRKAKTVLVTSDKNNILNTWVDQIARHTDWEWIVRPSQRQLSKFLSGNSPRTRAVLVNYDLLANRVPMFLRHRFEFWIGDESAEFKDARTGKHKGVWACCRAIPGRVLLNGKLMTERLDDIWGQSRLIGPMLGRSFYAYRTRFMQKSTDGFGWTPKRSSFSNIRKELDPYCFWHDGEGVKMPQTNYIQVQVEMTDEQKEIDEDLRERFEACFGETDIEVNHAAAMFQKRIQLCGGILRGDSEGEWEVVPQNKTEIVRKIVEENPGDKIVIWHTYIPETDLLRRSLDEILPEISVVETSDSSNELERFACDNGPRVALIRTSLCKGLNSLVGASIAVIFSNPLSFSRRAQLEGRTRRLTSTSDTTHYIDITTEGGADGTVLAMLRNKQNLKQNLSLTLSGLKKINEGLEKSD